MAHYEPFELFRREFGPLFERAFPAWPVPFETPWEAHWGLETEERENEYVVRAEVPGFEANELNVTLEGNMLMIRAEHRRETEETEATAERPYATRRLERALTLPTGVNLEAAEARYNNGVLEVHLPKTPEARPRPIEVKT
jgi:HSP20 family protein